MSAEDVRQLLGVSERTLRNYVDQGMPSRKDGRNRVFVWDEARDWWLDQQIQKAVRELDPISGVDDEEGAPAGGSGDIRALQRRKLTAETILKETDLEQKQGKVISIDDAVDKLNRMFGNLRAQLLGMAPKLAGRLEAAKDRTDREAALKDELENLCRELSTGKIVELPATTDDDQELLDVSAAADPAYAYGDAGAV